MGIPAVSFFTSSLGFGSSGAAWAMAIVGEGHASREVISRIANEKIRTRGIARFTGPPSSRLAGMAARVWTKRDSTTGVGEDKPKESNRQCRAIRARVQELRCGSIAAYCDSSITLD